MIKASNSNRSIVNIIGVPVILTGIFYDFLFPYMILVALVFCSFEYVRTINKLNANLNVFLFLFSNLIIFLNTIINFIDVVSLLILIFISLFIIEILFLKNSSIQNIGFYILGICWLSIFFSSSLLNIRSFDGGVYYTYLLFLSVWICDTFAFLLGRKFGKAKILPMISPNKTWFGCISGFLSNLVILISFYFINKNKLFIVDLTLFDVMVFSVIFGIFGQIGDFAQSMIKRQAYVKDTGTILMGHGGFFDRFDSLTFAAPLLYVYLYSIM